MNGKPPQSKKKSRILIVDDHPMVRERLAQVINEQSDLVACGAVIDAAQAMMAIERLHLDLALVDLNLKQSSGLELIKDIHCRWPELPMLVVSMHEDSVFAERTLRAGARGYISKEEATVQVVAAIRRILSGDVWVSDRMRSRLLQSFVGHQPAPRTTAMERLSDREIQIFQMVGRGLTTRRIAETLHVDPHTVETYRTRIKDKLGLTSSMEVLQRAVEWVQSNPAPQRTEATVSKHSEAGPAD